ncbi:hypothetical protein D3C75_590530 [compost metagenome]
MTMRLSANRLEGQKYRLHAGECRIQFFQEAFYNEQHIHGYLGMITPENGATFQFREETTVGAVDRATDASAPSWLKLSRKGNTFTGTVSFDGKRWTTVGTIQILMNRQVYIGMALSNPGDDTRNKAVFGNVKITNSHVPDVSHC